LAGACAGVCRRDPTGPLAQGVRHARIGLQGGGCAPCGLWVPSHHVRASLPSRAARSNARAAPTPQARWLTLSMGMMMMSAMESVVGCGAIEEPTSDLAKAEQPQEQPQEQPEQAASSASPELDSATADPPVHPAAPEPAVEQASRGYSSDDELNRRRRTALNASVRILPLPVRNTGGGPAAAAAAAAAGAGQRGIESGAPGSGKEEWQLALLALPEAEADLGQTGGSNGSSAPASQQQLADGQVGYQW